MLSHLAPRLLPSISLLPASAYFGREVFRKIASSTAQVSLPEADSVSGWVLPPPALGVGKGQEKKEDGTRRAHNICLFELEPFLLFS